MNPLLGEFLGTTFLILLGNGVVANVVLKHTKGNNSGWIVITMGWGMAVFVGVYMAASISGAHLNPAVTIGLAITGKFAWNMVVPYVLVQVVGAMIGSLLVWLSYRDHYSKTEDADSILATFCTSPAIPHTLNNFISEMIGTFTLVFGVLFIVAPNTSLGALDALPVAFLVLAIGLSLGGSTGYAINPARDFGPRLAHFLLPLKNKKNSNWSYSWIPILGPIAGGSLAALLFNMLG